MHLNQFDNGRGFSFRGPVVFEVAVDREPVEGRQLGAVRFEQNGGCWEAVEVVEITKLQPELAGFAAGDASGSTFGILRFKETFGSGGNANDVDAANAIDALDRHLAARSPHHAVGVM